MSYMIEQQAIVGFLTMDELQAFEAYLSLEGVEGFKRCMYRLMHTPTIYALRFADVVGHDEVIQVNILAKAIEEPFYGFYAFAHIGEEESDFETYYGDSEVMESNSIYSCDFLWIERNFGALEHEPLDLTPNLKPVQ